MINEKLARRIVQITVVLVSLRILYAIAVQIELGTRMPGWLMDFYEHHNPLFILLLGALLTLLGWTAKTFVAQPLIDKWKSKAVRGSDSRPNYDHSSQLGSLPSASTAVMQGVDRSPSTSVSAKIKPAAGSPARSSYDSPIRQQSNAASSDAQDNSKTPGSSMAEASDEMARNAAVIEEDPTRWMFVEGYPPPHAAPRLYQAGVPTRTWGERARLIVRRLEGNSLGVFNAGYGDACDIRISVTGGVGDLPEQSQWRYLQARHALRIHMRDQPPPFGTDLELTIRWEDTEQKSNKAKFVIPASG